MFSPTDWKRDEMGSIRMTREEFRDLWRYRELFYFFAWRDIKIRYRQTLLGVAWAILQPTFTMVVFTVLFGRVAQLPTDGIPPAIFYYAALLPWMYFSGTVTFSGNSLVTNSNLITKVYFPRAILPASATLSCLVDFGLGLFVFVGIMAYYRIHPSWMVLLWPVFAIPLVLLSLGVGMLLAALNTRFRDIKYAIPFGIQLLLFLTPVIYPTSMVPDRFRAWIVLNPLTGIIAAFRSSILPHRSVDWQLLGVSTILALALFGLGAIYFRSVERAFADII
jgi:lipopolysaccharide transport system permease protein